MLQDVKGLVVESKFLFNPLVKVIVSIVVSIKNILKFNLLNCFYFK